MLVRKEDAEAQYRHGLQALQQWRDGTGPSEALDRAVELLTSASESGDHDGARVALAQLYLEQGDAGVAEDGAEALRLAKQAADRHHPEAAHVCGVLLLYEWADDERGADHDVFDEAVYYFTLAAEGGHRHAQFYLGRIHLGHQLKEFAAAARGHLIGHDQSAAGGEEIDLSQSPGVDASALEMAAHWLSKAAEGGLVAAMRTVAELYLHGYGVEQSDLEAFGWFRLAADHLDPSSQCKTAWLFLKGTGTRQDLDEAERLFSLANEQGFEEARIAMLNIRALQHAARDAQGDYDFFLQQLKTTAPKAHQHAERCKSRQMQARPSQVALRYTHPIGLEDNIRLQERERVHLSAEADRQSEAARHLDAHLSPVGAGGRLPDDDTTFQKTLRAAEQQARNEQLEAERLGERYEEGERRREETLEQLRRDRAEREEQLAARDILPASDQEPALAVSRVENDSIADGRPLFKEPLALCARTMSSEPGLGRLPAVIEVCAKFVDQAIDSDECVHVFKFPKSLESVEKLCRTFDRGGDNLEVGDLAGLDVLDVAWVLRTWLAELPQSLLSPAAPVGDGKEAEKEAEVFAKFQAVGASSRGGQGEARAIAEVKVLLQELPADHFAILAFFMQLLHRVETESQRTMMDANRLALAVTPALLRDPLQRGSTRLNCEVVALMIRSFDRVFFDQTILDGTYDIQGTHGAGACRGCIVLGDAVTGYLVVYPGETSGAASAKKGLRRSIHGSASWTMDGNVQFTARGPLRSDFSVTVVQANLHQPGSAAAAAVSVEISCEFAEDEADTKKSEAQNLRGNQAQWAPPSDGTSAPCGECLSFAAKAPPVRFRLRCLGEANSAAGELLGEGIIGAFVTFFFCHCNFANERSDSSCGILLCAELEELPEYAQAWVQELEAPINANVSDILPRRLAREARLSPVPVQGEESGTVQLIVAWDPAATYAYSLAVDETKQVRAPRCCFWGSPPAAT